MIWVHNLNDYNILAEYLGFKQEKLLFSIFKNDILGIMSFPVLNMYRYTYSENQC